jgi:hypothetical protein
VLCLRRAGRRRSRFVVDDLVFALETNAERTDQNAAPTELLVESANSSLVTAVETPSFESRFSVQLREG